MTNAAPTATAAPVVIALANVQQTPRWETLQTLIRETVGPSINPDSGRLVRIAKPANAPNQTDYRAPGQYALTYETGTDREPVPVLLGVSGYHEPIRTGRGLGPTIWNQYAPAIRDGYNNAASGLVELAGALRAVGMIDAANAAENALSVLNGSISGRGL